MNPASYTEDTLVHRTTAENLTVLPPRDVLRKKLHAAIETSWAWVESKE